MFNSKLKKKLREQLEAARQVNADLINENEELKRKADYLMREILKRDQQILGLQNQISKNPDPFNFDFPGTEKCFNDFWAKFAGPKNKES